MSGKQPTQNKKNTTFVASPFSNFCAEKQTTTPCGTMTLPLDVPSESQSQPQQPGLLRLPPSVRHRIYDHIGLIADPASFETHASSACILDLNRPGGKQQHTTASPLGIHGLLLSCRLLSTEATQLLYSTNYFTVRYDRAAASQRLSFGSRSGQSLGLSRLRVLRPSSVQTLRHLQIILAEGSCHFQTSEDWVFGKCCMESDDYCRKKHRHDDPLSSGQGTNALLAEWDETAAQLASSVKPSSLDISVVCDVRPTEDGVQVAHSVVASLLRLPRVWGCHLRLCQTPHQQLQQLSHETVLRARHIISPTSTPSSSCLTPAAASPGFNRPSRLLALPRELRLHILSYTDLITPWREVAWSRQHRGFVVGQTFCETLEFQGNICPPSRHHGCQFRQCWITYPSPSAGCFCRAQHSAYVSPSPCQCWTARGARALFLVCRTLYRDAQVVFFSSNRFVVHDLCSNRPDWVVLPSGEGLGDEGYPYPSSRLGASIFLRDIVPTECLRHLRFLELVFPPYHYDMWPHESQPALRDWTDTLGWARTKLNVSGLTVRFIMAEIPQWERPGGGTHVRMRKIERERVQAGLNRILSPLGRILGGELSMFYAQMLLPWRWTLYETHARDSRDLAMEKEQEHIKEQAERLVLGERYTSAHSGLEPPASVWQHRFAPEF